MSKALDPLTAALKESQEAFTGSEQERDALDKAYTAQEVAADWLTKLEEQMVPTDYVTPVPPEYSDLPQLKKRATVEMSFRKGQAGSQFNVNGVNYPEVKLVMVIDGYTGTCVIESLDPFGRIAVLTWFVLSFSFHQPPSREVTL
jgi:phosphoribosylaminoimidazole-succinocarboxamide synthase